MKTRYFILGTTVAVITAIFGLKVIGQPILILASTTEIIDPVPFPYPTPTPTPTPSPIPTPTPTRIPTPKPTPSPTPIPQPTYTSEQIYNWINEYSGQYGLDPNVLRHVALCESGFNPSARTKIYGGLFQFDVQTWKTYRAKLSLDVNPDLRFDAREAIRTAAYMLSLRLNHLWPSCYPK